MKKLASLFLIASMMAACTACGGSDVIPADTDSTADTTEAVTTDDGLIHDDLGDIRFEGETFTMWLFADTVTGYIMEEETGEVFDDAVYARNRAVEERLGIKLKFNQSGLGASGEEQGQSCRMIENNILAGDTTNDVYLHVQHSSMPQLVNNHYFVDWNTIPNIDLTKPYWAGNAVNDINYGSKIYLMTGLYDHSVLSGAYCLFFNKNILDEVNIEYPYAMVEDGTWTYDKWKEIITATSRDLNGDGKFDYDNDRYGYFGYLWESPYPFFVGMGGDLLTKDQNNLPVNVIATEHNVDIIDRLLEVAFNIQGSTIAANVNDMFRVFTEGRAATIHAALSFAPDNFRDMEDDFGFVPPPKYDEAQKDYNVWIVNTSLMTYVPTTNTRLPLTGAVLEIMAMESYNRVIPAYIDTVLTIKSTRDTESEAMVPYIIDRASFFDHALHHLIELPSCILGNVGLATFYARNESKIEDFIETLTETYR
ncbi:MAG: hypothetical protein IJW77_10450 [Clostridia bacterium]|nr:hypothetical protein [Clostridia bacterium]